MIHPSPRGIVFDLDGTLVDSGLDFDLIRREMGLPVGVPVLEALAKIPEQQAARCRAILDRHERQGARQAVPMPGAVELLARLDHRGVHRAVWTRNARQWTAQMLGRCGLEFRTVITREDAPVKPDPGRIWQLCRQWGCSAAEVAIVGDYRHDLEAGRAAGAFTVLYTAGKPPRRERWTELADLVLASYWEAEERLFGPPETG